MSLMKELEALRDELQRAADLSSGYDMRVEGFKAVAADLTAIISLYQGGDWRPREATKNMAWVGGCELADCNHCDEETMIGWASYKIWTAAFDAYEEGTDD